MRTSLSDEARLRHSGNWGWPSGVQQCKLVVVVLLLVLLVAVVVVEEEVGGGLLTYDAYDRFFVFRGF